MGGTLAEPVALSVGTWAEPVARTAGTWAEPVAITVRGASFEDDDDAGGVRGVLVYIAGEIIRVGPRIEPESWPASWRAGIEV